MVYRVASIGGAWMGSGLRRIAPAVMLVAMFGTTGCTIVRGGGPEPLDALSVGTLEPGASAPGTATPAIFAAAGRALALGEPEWLEARSGAWGTVRRTGPDDERACTPAELTVHDYRGVRVERHALCPAMLHDQAP